MAITNIPKEELERLLADWDRDKGLWDAITHYFNLLHRAILKSKE